MVPFRRGTHRLPSTLFSPQLDRFMEPSTYLSCHAYLYTPFQSTNQAHGDDDDLDANDSQYQPNPKNSRDLDWLGIAAFSTLFTEKIC